MTSIQHDPSIGTSLMIHGYQGIDAHYKTAQLMAGARAHELLNNVRATGTNPGVRHRFGGILIAIGAAIAGKTHDIQARQATMPSPSSAKPGVVPTR